MEQKNEDVWGQEDTGEICDTLFYQGNNSSQTQALKYVGDYKIVATTGETMWFTGRNGHGPLPVIYQLHLGCEIMDVNLNPYPSYFSILNPCNFHYVYYAARSWLSNWSNGLQIKPAVKPNSESVRYHVPVISNYSFGQETDILSHKKKYDLWKARENKTNGLILWGVSRGTASTICALSQHQYPEVKLVILEGAIDSIPNVFRSWIESYVSKEKVSYWAEKVNNLFSFFHHYKITQFNPEGVSPLQCIESFPKGIPVAFITSEIDTMVPSKNTKTIAQALADRGENDVYLLVLENSSHPQYMYDDALDRGYYLYFIHALYKKYNLKHNSTLAILGEELIKGAILHEMEPTTKTLANCI